MKRELERALEDRCVARIEALGGLALKLSIPGVRGFPDRTVLLFQRVWFIEVKRLRSGRVSVQQTKWRHVLHRLGFTVYLIDTDAQFDRTLALETK